MRPTARELRAAHQLYGASREQLDRLHPVTTPRAKRSGPTPEGTVIHVVLAALRLHPRVAWAARMNTGSYKDGERFIRYGFPGLSDIIGQTKDGRFLAVECKAPGGGNATEQQAAFLRTVAGNGGVAILARCVGDVFTGELSQLPDNQAI
jgi:hypothetical protein